jgi:hypothetical protein
LRALQSKAPTIAQVEAELGAEYLYKAVTPADASAVSKIWTSSWNSPAEIEDKVRAFPETRIYLKSPMVFFIYFDSNKTMREFSCSEN